MCAHVGLAPLEVELLHLVEPALHDVDGLLVQDLQRAVEVGLADHARRVGLVDDDEVVRRDRAQADGVGRVRLVRPVPVARRVSSPPPGGSGARTPPRTGCRGSPAGSRGRTLSVVVNGSSNAAHLMWSTRICRLSGLTSACSGDASKKYDGWRTTNWSSGALLTPPAPPPTGSARRPARPTRCQVDGDRARVAGQDRDVERADVDAELERVGGHHAAHRRRRAAPSRSRAAGAAGSRRGSRG